MEPQELCTLVTLVSFLALISFVSPEPQEATSQMDDVINTGSLNKANEQDELAQAKYNNVCKTEVCKNRGKLITSYLNYSVSPCEDFYSFVCGNWTNKQNRTEAYDSFRMLYQRFMDTLADMLKSKTRRYSSQGVTGKPAILFEKCMDSKAEEENEVLSEIMRGSNLAEWPMTTERAKEKFKNATAVLLQVGMTPFIQFDVARNSSNQDAYEIMIFPLGIWFPREANITETVILVKQDIEMSDLKHATSTLTNLQSEWRKFQLPAFAKQMKREVPPSEATTIDNLEQKFTKVPLYSLLSKDFDKAKVILEKGEPVEVRNPAFYEAIDEFLGTADPAGLYNYIGLQLRLQWLHWSPSRASYNLRETYCTELVYKAMKEVVSQIYAKKHFTIAAKMEVEEIARRIKDAFEEVINGSKWMDEETRVTATQKLKATVAKIGYPDWILNTTVLENLYEHVPALYSNMSFINMMYEINENKEKKRMEKLRQTYNQDREWFYSPSPVNAFFNPRDKEFVYPLGGIQSPFFESGLPWSLNYGGIGTVMAHEITHALARVSHNKYAAMMDIEKNGKSEEFKETTDCFRYQYGNITEKETGIPLNGTSTLDENMADNSGLQISLLAYEKLLMDDCENSTSSLDGLPDLSGMELFFVGYGMLWCQTISEKELKDKIASDTHSPNRYRVNVPVQNLEAFAKTFNCSRQSPMFEKSTHNCTLW